MPHLTSSATRTDHIRALRGLVAWRTGDEPAFHHVMTEVMRSRDRTATPGMVFALFAQCSAALDSVGDVSEDEMLDQLRGHIARLTAENESES
jgi:hypothetical protein